MAFLKAIYEYRVWKRDCEQRGADEITDAHVIDTSNVKLEAWCGDDIIGYWLDATDNEPERGYIHD